MKHGDIEKKERKDEPAQAAGIIRLEADRQESAGEPGPQLAAIAQASEQKIEPKNQPGCRVDVLGDPAEMDVSVADRMNAAAIRAVDLSNKSRASR